MLRGAIHGAISVYLDRFLNIPPAALPGERLHWTHLLGGALGLSGAALLVLQKADGAVAFEARYIVGYLAALGCAFTWSIYSVMSRRFGQAPTDLVGAFCGATALLGVIAHVLVGEPTIWPADAWEWATIVALGLGPVGLAFFVWDYGVKRGDIKALGACSYASPLLSTLLLILVFVFSHGLYYQISNAPERLFSDLLKILPPILAVLGLYWMRWWAIRPPRIWADEIGARN